MKNILPAAARRPIGTLRELGTAREWMGDAVCILIWAAIIILALIVL